MADLSPFRSLVNFSAAGSHFALVSLALSDSDSLRNWIEFVDPAIGEFGLSKAWELPSGESDHTIVYGYHVFSGSGSQPFGTLNLVNVATSIADNPDPERTHLVLDYVFEPFVGSDPGRTGYIRCEVYQDPALADVTTHIEAVQPSDLGSSLSSVRTAFQYRRDGVIGRVGEREQSITVDSIQRRMRISIPLSGDRTPAFEPI